jgi:hypothetical protein
MSDQEATKTLRLAGMPVVGDLFETIEQLESRFVITPGAGGKAIDLEPRKGKGEALVYKIGAFPGPHVSVAERLAFMRKHAQGLRKLTGEPLLPEPTEPPSVGEEPERRERPPTSGLRNHAQPDVVRGMIDRMRAGLPAQLEDDQDQAPIGDLEEEEPPS